MCSSDLRIIDSAAAGTRFSKALAVNLRSLDILAPSGISERLIAAGQKIRRMILHEGGDRLATLHLDRIDHPHPFILSLPQNETERLLAEGLAELGVVVERQCALVGFKQTDGRVIATLDRGGALEDHTADYLIGADGAHSKVRASLGVGYPGAAHDHHWSLADVTLDWPYGDDEMSMFMAASGTVLLVIPYGERRFRIVAATPGVLSQLPFGRVLGDVIWQSDFTTSHRLVDHYGAGRVFLCGDAAHIHSPAGGRGMNLGIEDAAVLADRICHGGLETYSADRRPIGRSIIRQTDAMLSIMASRNPLARRVRNMVIRYLLPWEPMQSRLRTRIMGLAD